MSWPEIVKWFETDMQWKKIFVEKHAKIEDSDTLWDEIREEIGEASAKIIIPLLDQDKSDSKGNKKKLDIALKDA